MKEMNNEVNIFVLLKFPWMFSRHLFLYLSIRSCIVYSGRCWNKETKQACMRKQHETCSCRNKASNFPFGCLKRTREITLIQNVYGKMKLIFIYLSEKKFGVLQNLAE